MEARQRLGADRSLTILVADTATLKVIARVGGEGAEHALGQRGRHDVVLAFARGIVEIVQECGGGGGGGMYCNTMYSRMHSLRA